MSRRRPLGESVPEVPLEKDSPKEGRKDPESPERRDHPGSCRKGSGSIKSLPLYLAPGVPVPKDPTPRRLNAFVASYVRRSLAIDKNNGAVGGIYFNNVLKERCSFMVAPFLRAVPGH